MSYVQLVKRIAVFLCLDESKPLSIVVGSIKNQLNSTKDNVLIVIDAYNQLDEMSLTWLPCPLKANVNVIITGRNDVAKVTLVIKLTNQIENRNFCYIFGNICFLLL